MPPLHFGVLLLFARCSDGYEVGIGPKHGQDSILTPGFLGALILSFGQGKPWGISNMASGSISRGLGPKTVVLFTVLMTPVAAVHPGCLTCFGANPACTLHASAAGVCPYVEVPATNMNIIQKKESKALCLTNCLLPRFLRCFERGELTTASTLARRPAPGTTITVDPTKDKVATIMGYMKSGLISKDQMETAFAEAIDAASDAAKKKDLRANLQMLSNVKCMSDDGGSDVGQSGLLTWLLAKVTDFVSKGTYVTTALISAATVGAASTAVHRAKLVRPTSFEQFMEAVNYFIMYYLALGFGNAIILMQFIQFVVHDTMTVRGRDWRVAFELMNILFRRVEDAVPGTANLMTVSTEQFVLGVLEEAQKSAEFFWPIFFRTGAGKRAPGGGQDGKKPEEHGSTIKWNNKYAKDDKCRPCGAYNNKKQGSNPPCSMDHSDFHLLPCGTCKFRHVCNHWVSDKGPRGQCLGGHPRFECTNPNKCDDPVK